MTETLLVIHILAAAAWLGGGFLNGFMGPRMAAIGGETAVNWIRTVAQAANKYFLPAVGFTLISGVLLVVLEDAYGWGDAFVWVGLGVVVVSGYLVSRVMVPSLDAAVAAADNGDMAAIGPNARRAAVTGQTITVLLVLTEIAMVLRLRV